MLSPHTRAALHVAWELLCELVKTGEQRLGLPVLCQALALEPGHSVLDVGSGSGYLTMMAAHLVGEAGSSTGVEVSRAPLPPIVVGPNCCWMHAADCR